MGPDALMCRELHRFFSLISICFNWLFDLYFPSTPHLPCKWPLLQITPQIKKIGLFLVLCCKLPWRFILESLDGTEKVPGSNLIPHLSHDTYTKPLKCLTLLHLLQFSSHLQSILPATLTDSKSEYGCVWSVTLAVLCLQSSECSFCHILPHLDSLQKLLLFYDCGRVFIPFICSFTSSKASMVISWALDRGIGSCSGCHGESLSLSLSSGSIEGSSPNTHFWIA